VLVPNPLRSLTLAVDDLTQINGNREQLEGKIQARYGTAKDQVKKDVDNWVNNLP
jgi:uncharacterized protein YjbJ (UPF0337 family)